MNSEGTRAELSRVGDADLVARRQQQLAEAGTRLLARRSFSKLVVRDIAKEAGISVGLVYEYVRSKEDILQIIFDYWAKRVHEDLRVACCADGRPGRERLYAAVSLLVADVADKRPESVHISYREMGQLAQAQVEAQKQNERELNALLAGVVKDCVSEGHLPVDVDPDLAAMTILLLSHGWALKAYNLHQTYDTRSYVNWIVKLLGG